MRKWIFKHPAVALALAGLVFVGAAALAFGLRGLHRAELTPAPAWQIPESDPERGRAAVIEHGCGACHVIPGVRGANARVGPRLIGIAEQGYIAGVLPNSPENLVRWIQDPQGVNPRTAMPDLEVTEEEARDIAAFLYSIRE